MLGRLKSLVNISNVERKWTLIARLPRLWIIDLRGREVNPEQLEKYLIRARTVRVALQANGSFCAAVLAARKGKN